jgi:hypothetical protein
MSIAFPAEAAPRERPWGVLASLGAHALLLALVPLLALSRPMAPPLPPQAVEVELISAADLEPAVPSEAPVLVAPAPEAEPAEAAQAKPAKKPAAKKKAEPAEGEAKPKKAAAKPKKASE